MKPIGFCRSLSSIIAMLATMCALDEAKAQDAEAGSLEVSGGVALVSDYRFRGLSLSDHSPALQSELWLTHDSGLYAGVWGSTLAAYGGATVETDLTIGFAKSAGPIDFDVYATWYVYPGGHDVNYVEITSTISAGLGPVTAGLELAYAPPQSNIGNRHNSYGALHLSVPLGSLPFSAESSIGLEDGAFGDDKLDWSLELKTQLQGLELSVGYIDAANHGGDPLADPTAVLTVKKSF